MLEFQTLFNINIINNIGCHDEKLILNNIIIM